MTDRDIKPEKIDLDALADKANAASPGQWEVGPGYDLDGLTVHDVILDWHGNVVTPAERCVPEDAAHIAANSPDVTLAIVARIRSLEGLLASLADQLRATYTFPLTEGQIRAAIAKGTTR